MGDAKHMFGIIQIRFRNGQKDRNVGLVSGRLDGITRHGCCSQCVLNRRQAKADVTMAPRTQAAPATPTHAIDVRAITT